MTNVKNALTRKFGPLPAWAWALVAGLGLIWYRSHVGSSSLDAATQTSGNQATSPDTASVGPYGQDAYGITGGAGDGGGSSGAGGSGNTGLSSGPPVINVFPGNTDPTSKRKPKPKKQHKTKARGDRDKPSRKRRFRKGDSRVQRKDKDKTPARTHAHTHENRRYNTGGVSASRHTRHR